MFSSYNLTEFGKRLKNIRKSLGYTQHDVNALCGINRDTLRRIESGEGLPRYDTLETLSGIYKIDLLEELKFYRSVNRIYTYYHRLDKVIASFDVEVLNKLTQDYNSFMVNHKERLFEPSLYDQFSLLLEGISAYYSDEPAKMRHSLDIVVKSMLYSYPTFDVYNYANYKYNLFEMRILLLIALSLIHVTEYQLSNEILSFLLKQILKREFAQIDDVLLTIKIYTNLSYNAFTLDDYKKSLQYANEGIAFCNQNTNMFGLYLLFSRKGVAEFRLGLPNYLDSLQKSIHLLEIQNKLELAQTYREILRDRYAIVL